MALPSLTKTWEFDTNNAAAAAGSALATAQALLLAIKNALIDGATFSSPWTVSRSSNSVTANTSDNWTTSANIVWASSVSNRSWIVLRQTGISSTFEILIDCADAIAANSRVDVYASHAGFTGGTISARPTATDEIVVRTTQYWGPHTGVNNSFTWHMMQSDDGEITRVFFTRNGTCTAMWAFEVPKNTPANWTNPVLIFVEARNGTNVISAADMITAAGLYRAFGPRGRVMNVRLAVPTSSSSQSITLQTAVNSFTSGVTFWDANISSRDEEAQGNHGALVDMWWTFALPDAGDTFPNDSSRQFAAWSDAEPLVTPWDGSVVTI